MADILDGRPQSIIGGDDGRSQTTTTQTQQQACSDVCNNDCVTRSPAAVELGIILKESGCGTSTCSIDDCSTSKCNTRDCSANKCTLAAQCSTSKCSASQSQRHTCADEYSSRVAAAPASAPCIKNGQCCSTTQSGVGKFNEGGTFIDCKPMGRLAARVDDSSCDEKSPCCTSSKIRNTVDSGKTSPGRFHTDEKAAHANDDGSLCDCCLRYVLEDVLGRKEQARFIPWEHIIQFSDQIRKCCLWWGRLCCKSSTVCCSKGRTGRKEGRSSVTTAAKKEESPGTSPRASIASRSSPPLLPSRLLVKRMDCADCAYKASRTLNQLPSVKVLHLDYFQGTIDFEYDPDQIRLEAVARFVARATGFDIVADDARVSDANSVVLPVTFQKTLPQSVIEAYGLEHVKAGEDAPWWLPHLFQRQKRSSPKLYHLPVTVKGPDARNPRDVLRNLQEYTPLLKEPSENAAQKRVRDDLYHVAARTAIIGILSIPVLVLVWAELPLAPYIKYGVALALSTVIVAFAWPIFSGSFKSIYYARQADLGLLVTVSVAFSWFFSVVAFGFEVAGKGFAEPFFETVTLLLFLIYLGRAIQATTRRNTGTALRSLRELQCKKVSIVKADGSSESIDARLLAYDDVLRVISGERIPTDGLIVAGEADVDESILTGESLPLPKSVGKIVKAGSTLVNGSLDVQTTSLISENTLAAVATLVERAQASRTRYQELADRVAAKLLPIALCVSVVASIAWGLASRYARNESTSSSAVAGVTYAIAVMAVSCPCAIGLAVPLILSNTLQLAVKEGVVFRVPSAVEAMGRINLFAFDKTGTLSQGTLSVLKSFTLTPSVNGLVMMLAASSDHPIARAVAEFIRNSSSVSPDANNAPLDAVKSLPGLGISAEFTGFALLGGNADFVDMKSDARVSAYRNEGLSIFAVTYGGHLIALYGLQDAVRPGVPELIAALKEQSKKVMIVSGDNTKAVKLFADKVGIDSADAIGEATPADKAALIRHHKTQGFKVCYTGDGVNDTIALSEADVSVSIATGSDIAVAASDVVFLGNNIKHGIEVALAVTSLGRFHIITALAWCCCYFLFAILLAGGVFVKVRIAPRWAGLGELASIVPVLLIAAAMPVRWARLRPRSQEAERPAEPERTHH